MQRTTIMQRTDPFKSTTIMQRKNLFQRTTKSLEKSISEDNKNLGRQTRFKEQPNYWKSPF